MAEQQHDHYCMDCIHKNFMFCDELKVPITYTTYCTRKEVKKEEELQCKNCAYSDLDSDFCYMLQDKPDRYHARCSFLAWKPTDNKKTEEKPETKTESKTESKTDVKDLLPGLKKDGLCKDCTHCETWKTPNFCKEINGPADKTNPKCHFVEWKGYTASTYTGGYTTSYKKCHTGTIPVFKDPKTEIQICGGGRTREVTVNPNDIFLDVGFNCDKLIKTSGLKDGWKLEKYNKPEAIVKIDWSDGGAPNLSNKFWKELVSVLRTEKRRVVISCVGGHGRTGTVLSILSVLMGAVKKTEDPVKFIRDNYCKEAVETKTQCDYIEKITGCKIDSKPSNGHGTSWTYGGVSNFSKKEDKKEDEVTKKAIESLNESGIYDLLMY